MRCTSLVGVLHKPVHLLQPQADHADAWLSVLISGRLPAAAALCTEQLAVYEWLYVIVCCGCFHCLLACCAEPQCAGVAVSGGVGPEPQHHCAPGRPQFPTHSQQPHRCAAAAQAAAQAAGCTGVTAATASGSSNGCCTCIPMHMQL